MRRSKSGQHRKSKEPSNAPLLREQDRIYGRKSRGVEKEADGPRWQNATSLRPKNRCTCLVQRLRSTELVALPWPHDGTEWSRRQTPMRGNKKSSDLPCGRRRCGPCARLICYPNRSNAASSSYVSDQAEWCSINGRKCCLDGLGCVYMD
jgi:hypothetical protein